MHLAEPCRGKDNLICSLCVGAILLVRKCCTMRQITAPRKTAAFVGLFIAPYWLKSREHDDCSGSSASAFRLRLWLQLQECQRSDWSYI